MQNEPDEFSYTTRDNSALMIARAINELLFLEKFRHLAPFVAKELIKNGVRFSSNQTLAERPGKEEN